MLEEEFILKKKEKNESLSEFDESFLIKKKEIVMEDDLLKKKSHFKKMNIKKILPFGLISLLLVIGIVFSLGYIFDKNDKNLASDIDLSEIKFGINETSESVLLENTIPTLDKFGLLEDSYEFTIHNKSTSEKEFVIKLVDDEIVSTISNNSIRYELRVDDEVIGIYNLSNNGVLDSGILQGDGIRKYSVKFWLDYNTNANGGVWQKVISVLEGHVNLDTSGANEPVLADGMIPVYYDEDKEVWCKADYKNVDKSYQWYDYDDLIWANVVTVTEESRQEYMDASLGTEVVLDDINSFWVWIPRYKYTIFNRNLKNTDPEMIKITFEDDLNTTGSITCKNQFSDGISEVCTDNVNVEFVDGVSTYTHPAFTFNNQELAGFWVSKFEAGINNDSICAKNFNDFNCDKDNLEIVIKPNIKSLGAISLKNLFVNFRKMELKNNIYGFLNDGEVVNNDGSILNDSNNIDIHMILNNEWGAVSYLYHSQYGKYNNTLYTTFEKEIYHNVNNYTGYGTGSSSVIGESYPYNVIKYGTGASTTGNIYGVYDLNGGQGEFIMANLSDTLNKFALGEYSGFKEEILNYYYDSYNNKVNIKTTRLGDGLKETMWYNDSKNLSSKYLLYRGGIASGLDEGIFGINYITNKTSQDIGGRPVLNINNTTGR